MLRGFRPVAVFIALVCGMSAQQQNPASADAKFVSRTDFVVVPVVVTDKAAKHIGGLTKEDFRVFENGREQKIAQFEEVKAAGAMLRAAPPVNGIYTNRVVSGDPATTLAIVLVDQLNTRAVSQRDAIAGVLNFLDRWKGEKGFRHPMMLVALTDSGLQVVHAATLNPATLEEAIKILRVRMRPHTETGLAASRSQPIERLLSPVLLATGKLPEDGPTAGANGRNGSGATEAGVLEMLARVEEMVRRSDYDTDERTTFWALQGLASAVAGIPGRKALIWIGENFPFAQHVESGSPQWDKVWEGGRAEASDVEKLRSETLVLLNRAMISVYPIDAAGLLASDYFGGVWAGHVTNKLNRAVLLDQAARASDPRFVADQTAGVACLSTNGIADCLQCAIDDSAQHYLLAYYPTPKPKSAGWRHIKVDVRRERVNVRARHQYYFGVQTTALGDPKAEVMLALKSSLLYTGLPIALRFRPPRPTADGKRVVPFILGVDGQALTIDEGHGNHVSLGFGMQIGNGEATFRIVETHLNPQKVPDIRSTRLTHNGQLELLPGNYEVRLVLRDNLSGEFGSIVVPLKVD